MAPHADASPLGAPAQRAESPDQPALQSRVPPLEPSGADSTAHRALVAIPAYNEERSIGSLVLKSRLANYPVLVIDDGSTDRSAEIAEAAGARVERHVSNLGKTAALNTAFQVARRMGVQALVVIDGDGQYEPNEIEGLLDAVLLSGADLAIGSRFLATSGGQIPILRRAGQIAVTALTNVASGVWVSDSQSGFRAFSRRAIETLRFGSDGFGVEVEMQFQARQLGLRVIDVPITARYLDPPRRNVVRHGTLVLAQLLHLVERHRPLFCFVMLWLGLLSVAGLLGWGVNDTYQQRHQFAIGHALLTMLCCTLAFVALSTGVVLHTLRGYFVDLERQIGAMSASTEQRQS